MALFTLSNGVFTTMTRKKYKEGEEEDDETLGFIFEKMIQNLFNGFVGKLFNNIQKNGDCISW